MTALKRMTTVVVHCIKKIVATSTNFLSPRRCPYCKKKDSVVCEEVARDYTRANHDGVFTNSLSAKWRCNSCKKTFSTI